MKIRIYDAGQRNQIKSGYGLMAKQIANGLKNFGHDVSFFPREGEMEDITLWIRPPHYIKYPEFKESKKNVIFTMHETPTFEGWKKDWPSLLNRCEAIIVPTLWNKRIFKKHGVTKPITVVPLGVNSREFHGAKTNRFSILTLHDALGNPNSREDWSTTIKAYYEAFKNKEKVLLTIKSYNIRRTEFYHYLDLLTFDHSPPIDIVELELTTQSLNSLYGKHWLFVKNAIREGWSLPLIEAISCDLSVIYTDIPSLSWAKDYDKGETFQLGKQKQLVALFHKKYQLWKKIKSFVHKHSWRDCAKGVEDVIKSS